MKIPNIKNVLTRRFTFMFIPHGAGNPRQIEIPLSLLLTLFFVWTGITFWGSYLSAQHVDYWRTQISNRVLTLKVKYLLHQIDRTRSYLDEVKQLDAKLRTMLNAVGASTQATTKSPKDTAGTGGPSLDDQDDLKQVLGQADTNMTWKRIVEKAGLMTWETRDRISSYEDLTTWIETQKRLFRSMPTGWPCDGHRTSGYGIRLSPFSGVEKFHTGVDIAANFGTPVHATGDGRVVLASWQSGYGNMIILRHDFGYESRYAHLSRLLVKVGDVVKRGKTIALMGSTGTSSGPHCHYEVWLNSRLKNPYTFLIGTPLKSAPVVRLIKDDIQ